MSHAPELVKIIVDIPEGDLDVHGEGLWAKPLGDDLYEVRNSPWHSREINYLDVVKAIAPAPGRNPVVTAVERRSGHKTIQIIILDAGEPQKQKILDK